MNMSDTETIKKKKKPKYRLEDLDVFEVSLVAKPAIGVNYLMCKSADSIEDTDLDTEEDSSVVEKAVTKRDAGFDFPSTAYAYVPDPSKPSTWKIRLWESPTKKVTRRQVGMAVAALGKGFRGNKVQIPSGDRAKVKSKVRAAWRSVHTSSEAMPAVLKTAGTSPAEGAKSMNEKLQELLKSAELELEEEQLAALDTLFALKDVLPAEFMLNLYKEAGYEVPTETVEVEVPVEVPVEVQKTEESTESVKEPEAKEEVLKGLTDAQLALFKEQEDRIALAKEAAERAQEIALKERDARVTREYVVKAAEYAELPGTPDELGAVLRAIDEKLPEKEATAVLGVFKVAKEQIVASKQTEEIGTGGEPAGAETKPNWETEIKALVDKGEFKSVGDATEHLMRNRPELFLEAK